jgi:hypothetical protein
MWGGVREANNTSAAKAVLILLLFGTAEALP